mmetsp:Transcript_79860/g.200973  ORF Transcript_79860/g.200973 Transcript_79860/m.200973 type:complete len:270 (-) Transcript_79860:186-995(-)|eukprot:CAMPEP_0115225260 /NCGR_PEP_ID=MMETSP0270-20121206/30010_1 /TAXON_ID=71861 /ORGANISM="Scrippsiella trochoidea, Strain CCMP3099" /LENGTH=269 /DNA_ID=CAMNT_0002639619 /DNA_START=102 /DNA_END=911 /DNA_ORIENTATION=-
MPRRQASLLVATLSATGAAIVAVALLKASSSAGSFAAPGKGLRGSQQHGWFAVGPRQLQARKQQGHVWDATTGTLDEAPAGEAQAAPAEPEPFVKPAVWNTPAFRAVALVGGGAAAGQVLPFASMLHLTAYAIWLGTNFWTTFIAGISMFKNLPKQTFGRLQAVLFPKYFQLGTGCTAVVLLTGLRLGLPAGPAAISLLCTLANQLYLSPKATEVMFERYDRQNKGLKDPKVDKKLGAQFGKLHGLSSLANLLALVGLVAHGMLLAARL